MTYLIHLQHTVWGSVLVSGSDYYGFQDGYLHAWWEKNGNLKLILRKCKFRRDFESNCLLVAYETAKKVGKMVLLPWKWYHFFEHCLHVQVLCFREIKMILLLVNWSHTNPGIQTLIYLFLSTTHCFEEVISWFCDGYLDALHVCEMKCYNNILESVILTLTLVTYLIHPPHNDWVK